MENAINFVWGEMVETMVRLHPVAGVPHNRPAPNINKYGYIESPSDKNN